MLVVFQDRDGDDIAIDPMAVFKVEHTGEDGLSDISYFPRGGKAEVSYITVRHPVLEIVEAINKVQSFY